jgi:hypothetical protein
MFVFAPKMTTDTSSSLQLSSFVPPPLIHFCGRESDMKGTVDKLLSKIQHHIAILGGGGIGKTSLTMRSRLRTFVAPLLATLSLQRQLSFFAIIQVLKGDGSASGGDPMEKLTSRLKAIGLLTSYSTTSKAFGTRNEHAQI